jgi:sugar lactone lactonase YvrE
VTDRAFRTIVDGFYFGESPRWHDGLVWFSDIHGHTIRRTTLDGRAEIVAEVLQDSPSGLGWLPDGRLLVVAMDTQQLLRREHDGSISVHADLSHLARGSLNDMIVADDGTAYVGDMGTRIFEEGSERVPGQTLVVTPDGLASNAADDLAAPNGHVLSDDGRTLIVAESAGGCLTAFTVGRDGTLSERRLFAALRPERDDVAFAPPDGICLDAEGAVWVADPYGARVFRVREGGDVTDTMHFDDVVPVACVLAGDDRRTLVVCVSVDWHREAALRAPTARLDACEVDVPGAGRP